MYLRNYYKDGDWNAICDGCGFKFKASTLRKRWDGFMVCKEDFEYRHPQDYIRGPRGERALPWTRPEAPDQFVGPNYNVTNLVSFDGQSGSYILTPDSSALDITGDIDLVCYAQAPSWAGGSSGYGLISKATAPTELSYRLWISHGGGARFLVFQWSVDGTNLLSASPSVIIPAIDGGGIWIRVTMDVNDGAGNRVIRFYTSFAPPSTAVVSWTQLGATVTTSGTTSIFSSTSDLKVGSLGAGNEEDFAGKIYSAYIYNGIGGTLAASMIASDTGLGSSSWNSLLTGETWTLTGGTAITNVGNQGGYIAPVTNQGTL